MKKNIHEIMCRITLNRDIVDRFLGLCDEVKVRDYQAKKIISEELLKLWENLSFPVISQQQVLAKVNKLIKVFEKYRKRPNEEFEKNLPRIFDITKQS